MFFPLALDLVSPAMLGWMAAATAPLLIHLWSRRRYREMSWAAMEYLLAAVKSSRRKLTLEQWLLLAVRMLLVMLIVLAVAEPFRAGGRMTFIAGEPTHRILVIDGSYSMAYKPGDTSRFEGAKQLATQIVDQSPQGDGFTLVLMSDPPRIVVGTPVFEAGEFLRQIEDLVLPHTTADLSATLAKVEQVLSQARREHPRLRRHEVYFLSDLGRVGWATDGMTPPKAAQLRSRAQRLARAAAVMILDLGQPGAENSAVTHLSTVEPLVTASQTVQIEAEIRNFGRSPRSRQSVELWVDGRRTKQEHVDLAAGGEASVAFSHRFETPRDHAVEIRLAPDRLDLDDRRWLAVPVKRAIQVLCVDGRPSGRPFGSATDFLAHALSPSAQPGRADKIEPHVVPESALLELDLGVYDCVFLADVAQFTSSEARVLNAYTQAGGSLVFFLGDQVLADRYNRELGGGREQGVDLLPARLGTVVENRQHRLDPLDYRHPIVRVFRDREQAGPLTTPVRKYFKLTVPEDSSTQVALATGDGDPLIVERPVGRGRVVLLATSADTSWTPMPMWPSYVPIVQELLCFAIAGKSQERNLEVGQTMIGQPGDASGDGPVSIRLPSGSVQPLGPGGDGPQAWSFSETTRSGMYTVQLGAAAERVAAYAVNVDTAESDLAQLTPEELREEVWPGVPFEYRTSWEQPDAAPTGPIGRGGGLAKAILYAVLGLLFLETFLARRFGYHGT